MRGWTFVVALALAACSTETHERGLMGTWNKADSSVDPKKSNADPAGGQAPEPAGTRIEIPQDVVSKMAEFINRKSTIFADAVEVDLSRDGWLALASMAISADAVQRTDHEDAEKGVTTITLARMPGVPATKESVPTVRFGDGLRIVGVDRIVLRYSARHSAERPFWFHAVGAGKRAFYAVESEPPQEWRGSSVDVRNEIRSVNGVWRYDWSAEAKP
jgi:hypothetical protein